MTFFIFGHRHLPLDVKLNNSSRYINLGDWITTLHLLNLMENPYL